MLMLAYCAGLRGREIARLRLGDVNPLEKAIDIREIEVFKYGRPPLAPGVMAALISISLRGKEQEPRHMRRAICSGIHRPVAATRLER